MWTRTDQQLGKWSAIVIVLLSAVYIVTGAFWFISNIDFAMKTGLQPNEPYLAILETIILLCTPAMVTLFAAIHSYSSADKKTYSLAAFGFVILLVVLTGVVHIVNLTVARRTTSPQVAEILALYSPEGRLSTMLAVDLLGWDFFFGFAMLCAAPIFKGDRLSNAIRAVFVAGRSLCLIGFSGPVTGDMRLQVPAIIGYAFVFPFTCLLLALLFSRPNRLTGDSSSLKAG